MASMPKMGLQRSLKRFLQPTLWFASAGQITMFFGIVRSRSFLTSRVVVLGVSRAGRSSCGGEPQCGSAHADSSAGARRGWTHQVVIVVDRRVAICERVQNFVVGVICIKGGAGVSNDDARERLITATKYRMGLRSAHHGGGLRCRARSGEVWLPARLARRDQPSRIRVGGPARPADALVQRRAMVDAWQIRLLRRGF
jgi:hypothetical protein